MISRWLLIIGLGILTAGPTLALSELTQLTPGNIGHQQLAITVRCIRTAHSQQFWVTVKPKKGVPYHYVQPDDGSLIDGAFDNGTEGKGLPYHVTVSGKGKGIAVYRFFLPAHYLDNTRFQFGFTGYDTEPGMPVGDFYWFVVSAFAAQKSRNNALPIK